MKTEVKKYGKARKRLPIVYSLSEYLEVSRMMGEGNTLPDDFLLHEEFLNEPEDGLLVVISVNGKKED